MVQHYIFSDTLTYTIDILLFGTFFSYLFYFFSYKNQYQNILKHDTIYNLIKFSLTLSLGISYIFFIYFLYIFYKYYLLVSNHTLFGVYSTVPNLHVNIFIIGFEFSVDFFGVILLFLAYFVGILSLLALDNRIY